jgi:hypothetical protein
MCDILLVTSPLEELELLELLLVVPLEELELLLVAPLEELELELPSDEEQPMATATAAETANIFAHLLKSVPII